MKIPRDRLAYVIILLLAVMLVVSNIAHMRTQNELRSAICVLQDDVSETRLWNKINQDNIVRVNERAR